MKRSRPRNQPNSPGTATNLRYSQLVPNDPKKLAEFQHAVRYGNIFLSTHARLRMGERGADERDVKVAVLSATLCTPSTTSPGAWELRGGIDRDRDRLDIVAALIQPGILVVTVFG